MLDDTSKGRLDARADFGGLLALLLHLAVCSPSWVLCSWLGVLIIATDVLWLRNIKVLEIIIVAACKDLDWVLNPALNQSGQGSSWHCPADLCQPSAHQMGTDSPSAKCATGCSCVRFDFFLPMSAEFRLTGKHFSWSTWPVKSKPHRPKRIACHAMLRAGTIGRFRVSLTHRTQICLRHHKLASSCAMPVHLQQVQLKDSEKELFRLLKNTLQHANLKTTLRCAGGWVRDKLLGKDSMDIDIALDDMLGTQFAEHLNTYLQSQVGIAPGCQLPASMSGVQSGATG